MEHAGMARQVEGHFRNFRASTHPLDEIAFSDLAPAGYYIAVRLGFAFPLAEYNALPELWVEHYTRQGLMLDDPVMRWAYDNIGTIRWSELQVPDPRGVLSLAEGYGLAHGVVAVCGGAGREVQRSFGSFARGDREFSDLEIALLARKLAKLHIDMAPPSNLTRAELEVLRMVKSGMKLREIAERLRITEGAIKQRLKNARAKLGARNSSHAVSLAVAAGLI
jgi:LuxR family transcriptional regulator